MLRLDLVQEPRLLEIEINTRRPGETQRMQWLGELAGLQESLRHIADTKCQVEQLRVQAGPDADGVIALSQGDGAYPEITVRGLPRRASGENYRNFRSRGEQWLRSSGRFTNGPQSHRQADFELTRNLRATSGGPSPSANNPTASSRTSSRRWRPFAVSPPPSAYRIPTA